MLSEDYSFYPEDLVDIRKKQKVSQQEFADILGCDRNTLWRFERGKTKPSKAKIKMMADLLKINSLEISSLNFANSKLTHKTPMRSEKIKNHLSKIRNMSAEIAEDIEEYINSLEPYKKSYESAKQNNAKYIEILDRIPPIIYSKDTELRYTHVNRRFLDILVPGKKFVDIIGKKNTYLFSKDLTFSSLPKAFHELNKMESIAIQNGTEQRKKDIKIPGTERTGNVAVVPITDMRGKVTEIITTINDTTEQLATIRQQNNYLKIINDLDSMVWIKKQLPEEHYLFISNSCYALTGYTREELMGQPSAFVELIMDKKYRNDTSIIDPETNFFIIDKTHCVEITTKNGIKKWVDISIQKTVDENNDEIYFGINTDVTDIKDKTEMLNALYKAINKSNQFVTFVELNGDDLNFRYISDNIKEILGIDKAQYIHNITTRENNIIEPDKTKFYEFLDVPQQKSTLEYRKKDPHTGKITWFFSLLTETLPGKYIAFTSDITKHKEVEINHYAILDLLNQLPFCIKVEKINDKGDSQYIFVSDVGTRKIYEKDAKDFYTGRLKPTSFIFDDIIAEEMQVDKPVYGTEGRRFKIILESGEEKEIDELLFRSEINNEIYIISIQRDVTSSFSS